MRLDRLTYEPGSLLEFYEEGLTSLGALCERTWHDRLEIVADGPAAKLWNPGGAFQGMELTFTPADVTAARDAGRQVFPGCPLTFRLTETLRPSPLPLERVALAAEAHLREPDMAVAEKLWRAQFPDTERWRLTAPFKADWHFSLVALARCEIQAIDQHWSLHRLAIALPNGEPDEALAREISFAQPSRQEVAEVAWPPAEPTRWQGFLQTALAADLANELEVIRTRQENYLRRELERIDEYFENYERELSARSARAHQESSRLKAASRLAAAQTEHARRRADQVARHEIRVQPHWEALLLVCEPAWRAGLSLEKGHTAQTIEALLVPRARRWIA